MAKEKNYNPVAEHNRAQKSKQIKKNKATVAAQRNEKLARRNPERLQRQIEDLEDAEQNGKLKASEKKKLEELRVDLGRVRKAREKMGVKEDAWGRGDVGGVLGKRGRDGKRRRPGEGMSDVESSETDPDVGDIPMPKDVENMPPLPRKARHRQKLAVESQPEAEPVPVPSQTVYSAAPQVRNLIQEATSRFIPSSVASRTKAPSNSHSAALPEPEDLDKLEAARQEENSRAREAKARFAAQKAADEAAKEVEYKLMALEAELGEAQSKEEEERRANKVLHAVEIEEVEDEDL
jgi:WW domain binding protein 11